jgi:predicted RNA-binding protein with PUA-like domain
MVQSDALGVASVNAMTFDDHSQFEPKIAYFSASAPRWSEVDKNLTPFDGA